jgi:serine/threonine-protein kinase
MAELYLAKLAGSHGFERLVVVKRMLPHLSEDRELVGMFIDEARIISGIRHPNVVQVLDFGQQGKDLFLVMEYLEGEPISGLMRRLHARGQALDLGLAAWILAEACAGLHASHELRDGDGLNRGLVHRDVSPQNLFLSYSGQTKVIDFGIAQARNRNTHTEPGQMKGKYAYMSPEQCQGFSLDRRSDIYSLGIVLFELTTGRKLFKRDNILETLRAVSQSEVPAPSTLVDGYPKELEAICFRALAAERGDRFQTAAEMRRALLRVALGLGLREAPDEQASQVMHELFQDRISRKFELLNRVRTGQEVPSIPAHEVDLSTDLPVIAPPRVGGSREPSDSVQIATVTERKVPHQSGFHPRPASRGRTKSHAGMAKGLALFVGAACVATVLLQAMASPGDSTSPSTQRDPAVATVLSPPPPPPAALPPVTERPLNVRLRLATRPSGATVLIDGHDVGITPLDRTVPKGMQPVAVVFELPGYYTLREMVVPDQNHTLRLNLDRRRTTGQRHTRASQAHGSMPTPVASGGVDRENDRDESPFRAFE